jgi:hypothetical protein
MIQEQANSENLIEAVIYLKDGKRKYGMLMESEIADAYHFISNSDYILFQKENNESYIEIVPGDLIETIATNLK